MQMDIDDDAMDGAAWYRPDTFNIYRGIWICINSDWGDAHW